MYCKSCNYAEKSNFNEFNQITTKYVCKNINSKNYNKIMYEETETLKGQKSVIIPDFNHCELYKGN